MTNSEHFELMIEGFEESLNGLERVAISCAAVGLIDTVKLLLLQKEDMIMSIKVLKDHITNEKGE